MTRKKAEKKEQSLLDQPSSRQPLSPHKEEQMVAVVALKIESYGSRIAMQHTIDELAQQVSTAMHRDVKVVAYAACISGVMPVIVDQRAGHNSVNKLSLEQALIKEFKNTDKSKNNGKG